MLTLSDICKMLSISEATGKNWIRLGKITPTEYVGNNPYFSDEEFEKIKSGIEKNSLLKSRRNKRNISGNDVYKSYLSDNSKNLLPVLRFTQSLANQQITNEVIMTVIADCAEKLILQKEGENFNRYRFLVDDLLSEDVKESVKKKYPQIFNEKYCYFPDEDTLGMLYISLNSMRIRKATGAYYTPSRIVKKLCNRLFSDFSPENKTILDPCSGTGNFILQLPDCIDFRNVYATDIDEAAVKIARINYALKYSVSDRALIYSHIKKSNFLKGATEKYDFIIGNPPWGYDFSEKEKLFLRKKYACLSGEAVESYDVFLEEAFGRLKQGGVVSFVLPEAVLNVNSHRGIRELIKRDKSIKYLAYLGNVFDKVQCPGIILEIENTLKPFSAVGLTVSAKDEEFTINTERDYGNLSFLMNDREYLFCKTLEERENTVYLKDNADFGLGIVTGDNKRLVLSEKIPGCERVLKGADISKYKISNSENYIVFDRLSFQQSAPEEIYRASEKLLYRFIGGKLIFAYDDKQLLSLNSCNVLIPKIGGLNIKYVMALLNSRLIQNYYTKKFNSVKLLRSHIESIPIAFADEHIQSEIVGLADKIIKTDDKNKFNEVYEEIEKKVRNAYGV